MLDEFLKEISNLQEAHRLLEKLYYELGPYTFHKIIHDNFYFDDAGKLIHDLDKYFDFDDSE